MAFKYQALNTSRSSLTSVSSLGSSRSVDSARQQPRLEFSAAGNSGSRNLPASGGGGVLVMAADVERGGCSFTVGGTAESIAANNVPRSEWSSSRSGEGLCVEERDGVLLEPATGQLGGGRESLSPASMFEEEVEGEERRRTAQGTTSGAEPQQDDGGVVCKATSMTQNDQKTLHSSVESETGLYIHSSVLSGSGSLRFSRHGSAERQSGPSQTTRSDHGKLFKVLQRFSNKRAQQREEEEAEKRARKSPQHFGRSEAAGGGGRRDKENLSRHRHKRPSHKNNKHGKKGHFPVSKSNDLLSSGGFSDVVCCGEDSSEFDDSTSASTEGLLLMCKSTSNDDLSTCGLSHADPGHQYGRRGHQNLEVGASCHHGDGGRRLGSSRKYRVRRSSSLNERGYHNCDTAEVDATAMASGGTLPNAGAATNLSRNYSDAKYRKKLHVSFSHFRSRHS